jgi:hypothetical protein
MHERNGRGETDFYLFIGFGYDGPRGKRMIAGSMWGIP